MSISSICAEFLDYCGRERHLAPNTIAAYEQDLAEFCSFFSSHPIDTIGGEELVKYSLHLTETRKLSPATIKRRLACIRALFTRLQRQRIVPDTPFRQVDLCIRIPARLPRCLSTKEVAAMVARAETGCSTTLLASLLLFATGVRISELAAVHIEDIDLEQRSIRIFGKGSRERQVFIPDDSVIRTMRRYISAKRASSAPSEHLLINARGRPARSACLRARISRLAQSAGIDRPVTPHMFRHTAATALLEAGVDMRFVQRLLGHRSITTTQIYTHISDRALRAAIVRANVIGSIRYPQETNIR